MESEGYFRHYKNPPSVPVLSQINPVHVPHSASWRSSLIWSSYLDLGLPSGLFTSGFSTKTLYTSLLSSIRCTCPAHLILLVLITLTIFGEEYRELSSSLCSFLHSPVTSSLIGPNILLSTLVSKHLPPTLLFQCEWPSVTPVQNNRQNYFSVYLNKLEDKRFCTERGS